MKRIRLSLVLICAACGAKAPTPVVVPPTPPVVVTPPQAQRWRLTILSASIDGRKPDGAAWDEEAAAVAPPALRGSLANFIAAHPELEGSMHLLGEPVDLSGVIAAARKSSGPDPLVYVEAGGTAFRTTLAPGQFQPVWRFPVVFSGKPDDVVHITVVDWDGPGQADVIGDKVVTLGELTARPVVELGRFGNVERLVLESTPAGDLTARRRVAIPARDGWTDSGITLVSGAEVQIRAAGEVCSKGGDRGKCAGPEGQATNQSGNLPGFEPRPHAALVGGVGDARFFIGRELRFVAPSSGPLLLGVNDDDPGNDSGELEVDVQVK